MSIAKTNRALSIKASSLDPRVKASGLDLRTEALGLEFDMQGWLGLHVCREKLY